MIYIETKQQTKVRQNIVESIEDVTGVPRELWEIRRSRTMQEVLIRHIYIHMLYNYGNFTLQNIARIVGLKNHCTIIQSLNRTKEWYAETKWVHERILLDEIKEDYEQRINKTAESLAR
jgi:chromosomal replication initiation ATPase DnaA